MITVRVVAAYRDKTGAVVKPSREPCLMPEDVAAALLAKKCIKILDVPAVEQEPRKKEIPHVSDNQSMTEQAKPAPVRRRGRPRKKDLEG